MRAALGLLALLAACADVNVRGLTAPPPGREAVLDADGERITLSRGVALAFDCQATDGGYAGPCRGARATSDDPAVAVVYRAHLDDLVDAHDDGEVGAVSAAAFVVAGRAAGATVLRLTTDDGDVDLVVTVR